MAIREFLCPNNHTTEKILFGEADIETKEVICADVLCFEWAERVEISLPGAPILLGEGFYKPSQSGRTTSRGNDPIKAANDVIADMRETNGGKLPLNNPFG